jgi:hypothetical protein
VDLVRVLADDLQLDVLGIVTHSVCEKIRRMQQLKQECWYS